MVFEKTIFIDRELLDKYSDMLNIEPADESECLGEDETISYTADFGNGMEIDVKICGVQYKEGESNTAWTEAVLFHNGSQVACTDVCDEFAGDWQLDYNGDTYIVHVKENPYTIISWSITGKHGKKQPCTMAACKITKEHFHGFEICLPDGRCLKIGYEDNETACRISLFDPEAAEAEGRQDIAETAEICGNFILLHP